MSTTTASSKAMLSASFQQLNLSVNVVWLGLGATVIVWLAYQMVSYLIASYEAEAKLSSIPKPTSSYPFSHLIHLITGSPWEVLRGWLEEYGPIIRFHFGRTNYIVVSEPDIIQRIFQQRNTYIKCVDAMKTFHALLGNGLVTSEGEEWSSQRACLAPVLRTDILQFTTDIAIQTIDRFALFLHQQLQLQQSQTQKTKTDSNTVSSCSSFVTEMGEHFRHLTLQVIGETVLSLPPSETETVLPSLYLPIADECTQRVYYPFRAYLPFLPAFFQYHRCVAQLNNFVNNIIQQRCQLNKHSSIPPSSSSFSSSSSSSVMSLYSPSLSLSDVQKLTVCNDGRPLDILDRMILSTLIQTQGNLQQHDLHQLRDQIKTFLFAGHETTSMMLTWALYELMLNPECMAAVHAEALETWGTLTFSSSSTSSQPHIVSSRTPSKSLLVDGLGYTVSVLKETLRKWSVVPLVTRTAAVDDTWSSAMSIPAGSHIAINLKAVHWRADLWPDPERFDPLRFYDPATKTASKRPPHPYAYLPFIQGPRNCLGQHFALLEAKIFLSRLVLLFHFSPFDQQQGVHQKLNIPVAPIKRMQTFVSYRQSQAQH